MSEMNKEIDQSLLQLIISLQAGAMQQMGKIASPITGKIERDIEVAKHTINMLDMLHRKMKGNLTDDEEKLLSHVLYELRINFVDEQKKPSEDIAEAKEDKKTDTNPTDEKA